MVCPLRISGRQFILMDLSEIRLRSYAIFAKFQSVAQLYVIPPYWQKLWLRIDVKNDVYSSGALQGQRDRVKAHELREDALLLRLSVCLSVGYKWKRHQK